MQAGRHYMRRNHGTETPSNLVFIDTESYQRVKRGKYDEIDHSLMLWCAVRVRIENGQVTRRCEATGETAESFWTFLDRVSDKWRTTWVFAHNIGFDVTLLGFLDKLDRGEFTMRPLYRKDKNGKATASPSWSGRFICDGPNTIIRTRTTDKRFTFVDTGNYFPSPLEEIGPSFGLPQLAKPDSPKDAAGWLRRCRRDVEIVERVVTTLITNWIREDCGAFQPTAASLAFTNWRHTCPILTPDGDSVDMVCDPNAKRHDMEREAFYGPRVTTYFVGKVPEPVWHVDVNSLYPFVMREHSYPRRYVRDGYRVAPAKLEAESRAYGIVGEVFLRTGRDAFPVRIDGRQCHVVGNFWTTLCGPELHRALRLGVVVKTGRVQYYSVAPMFRAWCDKWYARKQRADRRGEAGKPDREFSKLIMLSLSGKYAQHGRRWEDVPGHHATERWGGYTHRLSGVGDPIQIAWARGNGLGDNINEHTGRLVNCRGIAGHAQILQTTGDPAHAFPAVSGFIAAHAREYMLGIIQGMPERSVYYLAVDGMIVSRKGLAHLEAAGLLHPDELGYFKVKGPYKHCRIRGANDYELDSERIVAGWRAKAKAKDGVGQVLQVWERLQSTIAQGPQWTVRVREMPVTSYRYDRKGVICTDGWWRPYRLDRDSAVGERPPSGGYTMDELGELRLTSRK